MSALAVAYCPDCGSPTKRHCSDDPSHPQYSHTCDWWACTSCFTYGNHLRAVVDKRRRGVA